METARVLSMVNMYPRPAVACVASGSVKCLSGLADYFMTNEVINISHRRKAHYKAYGVPKALKDGRGMSEAKRQIGINEVILKP